MKPVRAALIALSLVLTLLSAPALASDQCGISQMPGYICTGGQPSHTAPDEPSAWTSVLIFLSSSIL